MTPPDSHPVAPSAALVPARLSATIGCHSVVDFFSFALIGLMPSLGQHFGLSDGKIALMLALGSLISGLIQPVVAWFGDRHDTRLLGVVGFGAAVVAISCAGYAQQFWQLLILHAIGTAGIGAFHPAAAAAVGHFSGALRSLGLSAFFLAGMIGGMAGNTATPAMLRAFDYDLHALVWLIPPGLVFVVVLAWAIGSAPHRHADAHDRHARLSPGERAERWVAVGVLYVGNVLRFTVNMALVHLFIEWSRLTLRQAEGVEQLGVVAAGSASTLNGFLQASMQLGMGAAGLTLGFILRPRHEKPAIVCFPILGAVGVALFPSLTHRVDLAVAGVPIMPIVLGVIAGMGFGGIVPITMSLAQRLLPHRTGLASGMMLGGAWALAASGPPLAKLLSDHLGLDRTFWVVSAMLALSGVVSLRLPGRLIREALAH